MVQRPVPCRMARCAGSRTEAHPRPRRPSAFEARRCRVEPCRGHHCAKAEPLKCQGDTPVSAPGVHTIRQPATGRTRPHGPPRTRPPRAPGRCRIDGWPPARRRAPVRGGGRLARRSSSPCASQEGPAGSRPLPKLRQPDRQASFEPHCARVSPQACRCNSRAGTSERPGDRRGLKTQAPGRGWLASRGHVAARLVRLRTLRCSAPARMGVPWMRAPCTGS